MIQENMGKPYYQANIKGTDDKKGITKLKDLLSLPIDEFTQAITEQKSLVEKTDGKFGFTLLFLSVQNQLDQQTKILLDKGANPNQQNRYGESPLHLAIEKLNHKIINLLLDKQANPNIQQEYGETAMHFAARKGDYKVLKLLLLYQGDDSIRANDGSLPIDYAREYCNDKCIEIFESEQKKQKSKHISSQRILEEVKANGLTSPTSKFDPKFKESSQMRLIEEYDYVQYPPLDSSDKKDPYGSKSVNINTLNKLGDMNSVSSINMKENGINSINLRKTMLVGNRINQLASKRYDANSQNNNENSYSTPKNYKPKHKEENFDYFASKSSIVLHSKKNDIKVNKLTRGSTLKTSLSINVLRNSIRLTKSYFEEELNARNSNFNSDNNNNPSFTSKSSKGSQDLYNMLKEINMEKYTDLFVNEGFDDLSLFIQETKYLNDSHLKLIGITKPGDRAKILIKIESESKRLRVKLNEAVFYISNDPTNCFLDSYLYSVYQWLQNNKLEEYYNIFFNMGYHSIELLYIQMITNNPLTDDILKNDLHIEKLGHRIRILNQLNEDAQVYVNKVKLIEFTTFENESLKKNSCTCVIY